MLDFRYRHQRLHQNNTNNVGRRAGFMKPITRHRGTQEVDFLHSPRNLPASVKIEPEVPPKRNLTLPNEPLRHSWTWGGVTVTGYNLSPMGM